MAIIGDDLEEINEKMRESSDSEETEEEEREKEKKHPTWCQIHNVKRKDLYNFAETLIKNKREKNVAAYQAKINELVFSRKGTTKTLFKFNNQRVCRNCIVSKLHISSKTLRKYTGIERIEPSKRGKHNVRPNKIPSFIITELMKIISNCKKDDKMFIGFSSMKPLFEYCLVILKRDNPDILFAPRIIKARTKRTRMLCTTDIYPILPDLKKQKLDLTEYPEECTMKLNSITDNSTLQEEISELSPNTTPQNLANAFTLPSYSWFKAFFKLNYPEYSFSPINDPSTASYG